MKRIKKSWPRIKENVYTNGNIVPQIDLYFFKSLSVHDWRSRRLIALLTLLNPLTLQRTGHRISTVTIHNRQAFSRDVPQCQCTGEGYCNSPNDIMYSGETFHNDRSDKNKTEGLEVDTSPEQLHPYDFWTGADRLTGLRHHIKCNHDHSDFLLTWAIV